jgi:hypothetical protein
MSDADTPLLTQGLLEELEKHWERQQAPVLTRLQPGLSGDEMDALVAPLGLRLPVEARAGWGWHDGAPAWSVSRDSERNIGATSSPFLPLAEAADITVDLRGVSADDEENAGDRGAWPRDWLVLTQMRGPLVIDCLVADREPGPLHLADYGALGLDVHRPRARSLGELVHWWDTAFDLGAWRYYAQEDAWIYNWDLLPEQLQRSWLV